ncbi:hypothetical protein Nepgr_001541 [Nepenthes gracilis]|uniref:H(+)-exporting diphosphatase n=1 Tax=Nepenthes gracilis TaxID=150966 RepID=A0AAD3RW51_NEPGR|nr:hypothetical protein Nepgr_001541 [Nepenthes gracilis]
MLADDHQFFLIVQLCYAKLLLVNTSRRGFISFGRHRILKHNLVDLLRQHSQAFDKAYEDLMRAVTDCNKSGNLRANSRLNSPATVHFTLTFPPFPIEDYTGEGNGGESDLTPGAIGSQIGVALPFQNDKEGQLGDRDVFICHSLLIDVANFTTTSSHFTACPYVGTSFVLAENGRLVLNIVHSSYKLYHGGDWGGKVKGKSPKDHPRHSAVIANKVGDAVGGMVCTESDLFGSVTAFIERAVSLMSSELDLNASVCVEEILLFFPRETIPIDGKGHTARTAVAKFMLIGSNSTTTEIVQLVALSAATLDLWRPSTSPDGSSVSDGNFPERVKLLVFRVAILSSVVGSQAIISGTFSIINQSQSLSCFPRVKVVHTSKQIHGQVYISEINWILMARNIVALVDEFAKRVYLINDLLATRGEIALNFIGCMCELLNLHGARCDAENSFGEIALMPARRFVGKRSYIECGILDEPALQLVFSDLIVAILRQKFSIFNLEDKDSLSHMMDASMEDLACCSVIGEASEFEDASKCRSKEPEFTVKATLSTAFATHKEKLGEKNHKSARKR